MNDQLDHQSETNDYFVPHDTYSGTANLPPFDRLTSISITLAFLISIVGAIIIPTGILWFIMDFKRSIHQVYQYDEELLSFILCVLSIIVTINAFTLKHKTINLHRVLFLVKIWNYWFIFVVILTFYTLFT